MLEFAPDVCGTDVDCHTLHPRTKSHSRQLSIATSGQSVPYGHPNILHDIIDVARAANPRQMRDDVTPHPFDGHHQLVHRYSDFFG
jgi:hypothetical protein